MSRRNRLAVAARTIVFACAACAFACVRAGSADPAERVSAIADQERLNVTIYNGTLALVHDRRRVALDAGDNRIAWRDVSGKLDGTSAILEDLTTPGGVSVTEQNFDFDLLNPNSLLAKYVGRRVTVVHDKPGAGRPASEPATVLADNDGGVVLQYADRIETGLVDSHIAFPELPPDLRDRPTLVLDVASAKAGTPDLDLSYITAGLGWQADYVGVVSPDESQMDLNGLVTLTNETGTTFRDAHVQLVAGNVNVPQPSMDTNGLRFIASARARSAVSQENYFEYHLYTIERPTTIANAQTKQVALLAAHAVPVRKTLEVRGQSGYYEAPNEDLGSKLPVGVYLTFTNEGGDLGVPLPGGTMRLYENDSRGTSQFLGADRIEHTPRNQDVRLHLGDSFDVTATKKQTDYRRNDSCTFESAYAVAVSNAKDSSQSVELIEPIPGDWTVLAESAPHRKTSSSTATWTLTVPSNATTTLTYRVRTRTCP